MMSQQTLGCLAEKKYLLQILEILCGNWLNSKRIGGLIQNKKKKNEKMFQRNIPELP